MNYILLLRDGLLESTTAFLTALTAFLVALTGVLSSIVTQYKLHRDLKRNTRLTESTAESVRQLRDVDEN